MLFTPQAAAQSLDSDTWVQLALYYPDVDTKVGIAPPDDPDFRTLIDLESDLDLSDRDALPSATIGRRISQHWSIEAEFYKLKRTGETSISRDLIFDGVTYPVSAAVRSGFSSDVYRLTVGYAFLKEDNFEMGATLGVHATDFEVFLEGEVQAGEAGASTETRSQDLLAPLPTVGLYGIAEVTPGFTIGGKGQFLSLKIGDYDGRLINLQATASYHVTSTFEIGVMYRYVDYRLDIEKDRYVGRVQYGFHGPGLFLGANF